VIAHDRDNRIRWVSPFGNRRVNACSQLTDAYRSVPRPSSPVHAKASTNCPYLTLESPHHQRQRWIGSPAHQSDTLMGTRGTDTKLGRAACVVCSVWMINLSHYLDARSERSNLIVSSDVPASVTALQLKPKPSRHRFEKPIHNVKKPAIPWGSRYRCKQRISCFIIWITAERFASAFSSLSPASTPFRRKVGGAYRDRTDDLKLAKLALSQLS
jgi:hypothetical protein